MDLQQISDFYLQAADAQLAEKLILVIEQAMSHLTKMPERGSEVTLLTQETGRLYQQYIANPFRIIYRIHSSKVFIVMILHQRQSMQKALKNRLLR